LDKIKRYLEEKNLAYHEQENEINVPYLIEDKKFQIVIQCHDKWLVVSSLIVKRDQVPDDQYESLMRELLVANHELPEINYELSREGDVYTSVDMRFDIVDYDNFFSEFYAIPFGIKRFMENIAPPLNIEVKGFE
jgi:hypothetical protein